MSDSSTARLRRYPSQNDIESYYKFKKRGHETEELNKSSSLSLKKSKTVDNLFGLASFHNPDDDEQLLNLRLEPDVLRRFDTLTLNTTNDCPPQTDRSSSYGSDCSLGRTFSSLDDQSNYESTTGTTATSSSIPYRQQGASKVTTFHDESGWSFDYSNSI